MVENRVDQKQIIMNHSWHYSWLVIHQIPLLPYKTNWIVLRLSRTGNTNEIKIGNDSDIEVGIETEFKLSLISKLRLRLMITIIKIEKWEWI